MARSRGKGARRPQDGVTIAGDAVSYERNRRNRSGFHSEWLKPEREEAGDENAAAASQGQSTAGIRSGPRSPRPDSPRPRGSAHALPENVAQCGLVNCTVTRLLWGSPGGALDIRQLWLCSAPLQSRTPGSQPAVCVRGRQRVGQGSDPTCPPDPTCPMTDAFASHFKALLLSRGKGCHRSIFVSVKAIT